MGDAQPWMKKLVVIREITTPAEQREQRREPLWFIEQLDDLERTAVVELTTLGHLLRSHRVVPRRDIWVMAVVDQKHRPTRRERLPDAVPERGEPGRRHVRQPEPEEDEVVGLVRLPRKNVALLVAHGRRPDPRPVQRQHLGRRVDRGHDPVIPCEPLCPQPGTTGQLKHPTRRL